MTQYIFMNEQIREERPARPVIVCQDNFVSPPRQREANEFELWVHGQKIGRVVYDPNFLAACETHEVKAWVELDDIVLVRREADAAAQAPVAREKKPNEPIRLVGLQTR